MEVNRLLSDELSYELRVRGAPDDGTVCEKRQRLRELMRLEKMGAFTQHFSSELKVEEEIDICQTKIKELAEIVENFDVNNAKNDFSRLQSRLIHVAGRLNRITDPNFKEVKCNLLMECGGLGQFDLVALLNKRQSHPSHP